MSFARVTLCLFLLLCSVSRAESAPATRSPARVAPAATYSNPLPVDIADPFVYREAQTYYLYGTNARDGFEVWTSPDLVNWAERGYAFQRDDASFGRFHFWAPEMFKHRGKYFLHYTAGTGERTEPRRRIILCEGDSPLGPFKEIKTPWLETGFDMIDSHVFRDQDGQLYLYYVRLPKPPELKHFEIRVHKLDANLNPSKKSTLCISPSEKWEGGVVNEGPFVIRHGAWYILTYSGQGFENPNYSVGIATARSPLGPWTKSKDGPILHRSEGTSGTGHHCFIESPDRKEQFIVYHEHKFLDRPGGLRVLAIDRVKVIDRPGAAPTMKVAGPTTRPQPMPSGSPVAAPAAAAAAR